MPPIESSSELLVPPTVWRSSMCGRARRCVALRLVNSPIHTTPNRP